MTLKFQFFKNENVLTVQRKKVVKLMMYEMQYNVYDLQVRFLQLQNWTVEEESPEFVWQNAFLLAWINMIQ